MKGGIIYYIGQGWFNEINWQEGRPFHMDCDDMLRNTIDESWTCVIISWGLTKFEARLLEAYLINLYDGELSKPGTYKWDGKSLMNKHRERTYKGVVFESVYDYLSTEDYVSPFVKLMKKFTNDFSIQVQLPSQLTITDSKEDITYNRVWVQAIMPSTSYGYSETINLVYALDVRKPIYKIFKAYKDKKTGNLFAFNSQWINVYELKPSEEFVDFEPVVKHLLELTDDSERRFEALENCKLSSEPKNRQQLLGELIENSMLFEINNKGGKIKIAPQMVLKAFQNVYMDSSSRNYVTDQEECTKLNYLDAFSSLITEDDKDIVNRFEKNLLVYQMFTDNQ